MHHLGPAYENACITAFSGGTDQFVLACDLTRETIGEGGVAKGEWGRDEGVGRARIAAAGHFIRHIRFDPAGELAASLLLGESLAAFIFVSPR